MPFDPSTISDIGSNAVPDVSGSQGKAFQLKDMLDENTLNKYKLKQAAQEDQDSATRRKIAMKYDITDPKQRTNMASEFSKAGLTQDATQALKVGQELDSGAANRQLDQLNLHNQALSYINQGVGQIVNQVGALRDAKNPDGTPKYDQNTINAMTQAQILKLTNDIKNDSSLAPDVKQLLMGQINKQLATGKAMSFDQLSAGYTASKEGQAQLQAHLAQMKDQATIANQESEAAARGPALEERTRHDRAMETIQKDKPQGGRYGIVEPTTPAGQKLKEDFMGLTGGKVTLAQLRGLNFDQLSGSGKTAQQLVQSGLTYTGQQRAAGAEGQRAGNVAILEGSVGGAADQVLDALKGVDRGNIQAVNKAIAAGKTQFGDASESRYAASIQSLINEYSRVISGGTGQSTDAARREGQDMLSRAQSPEQVQAVISQMRREVQIVQQASEKALSGQSGALPTLSQPGSAPAAAPDAAPAAPANTIKWSDLK